MSQKVVPASLSELVQRAGVKRFIVASRSGMAELKTKRYFVLLPGMLTFGTGFYGTPVGDKALLEILTNRFAAQSIDLSPDLQIEQKGTKLKLSLPTQTSHGGRLTSLSIIFSSADELDEWRSAISLECGTPRVFMLNEVYVQALHAAVWRNIQSGNEKLRKYYFSGLFRSHIMDCLQSHFEALLGRKQPELGMEEGELMADIMALISNSFVARAYFLLCCPVGDMKSCLLCQFAAEVGGVPTDMQLYRLYVSTVAVVFSRGDWKRFATFATAVKTLGRIQDTDTISELESEFWLQRWEDANRVVYINGHDFRQCVQMCPYLHYAIIRHYALKGPKYYEIFITTLECVSADDILSEFGCVIRSKDGYAVSTEQGFVAVLLDASFPNFEARKRVLLCFGNPLPLSFLPSLLVYAYTHYSDCGAMVNMNRLFEAALFKDEGRSIIDTTAVTSISRLPYKLFEELCIAVDMLKAEWFNIGECWRLLEIVLRLEGADPVGSSEVDRICRLGDTLAEEAKTKVSYVFRTIPVVNYFAELSSRGLSTWYSESPITAARAVAGMTREAFEQNVTGLFSYSRIVKDLFQMFLLCFPSSKEWMNTFLAPLGSMRDIFVKVLSRPVRISDKLVALVKGGSIWLDASHFSSAAIDALVRPKDMWDPPLYAKVLTCYLYIDGSASKLNGQLDEASVWCSQSEDRIEYLEKILASVEDRIARDLLRLKSPHETPWFYRSQFQNASITLDVILKCADDSFSSICLLMAQNSRARDILTVIIDNYLSRPPQEWPQSFRWLEMIAFFIKYISLESIRAAYKAFEVIEKNESIAHLMNAVKQKLPRALVEPSKLEELLLMNTKDGNNPAQEVVVRLENEAKEVGVKNVVGLLKLIAAKWMVSRQRAIGVPIAPRNAQMITMLIFSTWAELSEVEVDTRSRCMIAQVGTGEGKSLIIAMVAAYFAICKEKRVHVLENNAGLLEKDYKQFEDFYQLLGIRSYHDYCYGDFPSFGPPGSPSITYCLRPAIERYYRMSIMSHLEPFEGTVLIVDEVDDLIVDGDPNKSYTMPDKEGVKVAEVFQKLKDNAGVCERTPDISSFVYEYSMQGYLSAKSYELGTHYNIFKEDGKYYAVDHKGQLQRNVADAGIDYLNYCQKRITPPSESPYFVQSMSYMMSKYERIIGLSGSLGSPAERDFLTENYNASFFEVPPFLNTCKDTEKRLPKLLTCQVHANKNKQFDAVVALALSMHGKVPILIITKNPLEAIELVRLISRALKGQDTNCAEDIVQLLLEKDVTTDLPMTDFVSIVGKATKKAKNLFRITITDPFGGRGHDYVVNDQKVNENGGLCVIIATLPKSQRDWIQWVGRTSRNDRAGQYALICNRDDKAFCMIDPVDLENANLGRGVNYDATKLLRALFAGIDDNAKMHFRKLFEDIKKGKEANYVCDIFYKTIGSADAASWPKNSLQLALRDYLWRVSHENQFGIDLLKQALINALAFVPDTQMAVADIFSMRQHIDSNAAAGDQLVNSDLPVEEKIRLLNEAEERRLAGLETLRRQTDMSFNQAQEEINDLNMKLWRKKDEIAWLWDNREISDSRYESFQLQFFQEEAVLHQQQAALNERIRQYEEHQLKLAAERGAQEAQELRQREALEAELDRKRLRELAFNQFLEAQELEEARNDGITLDMLRLYKKLKFSQIEYNLNELRKSALNSYTDDREFVSTGNALKQEKDKYLRELPYIKRAFEEKDYPDVLNYLLEQLRAQGQEHANSSQFEYCESVRKKIREVSAMMPRTKKALTPLSSPHLGVIVARYCLTKEVNMIMCEALECSRERGVFEGVIYYEHHSRYDVTPVMFKISTNVEELQGEYDNLIMASRAIAGRFVEPLAFARPGELISDVGEDVSRYAALVLKKGTHTLAKHLKTKGAKLKETDLVQIADRVVGIVGALHSTSMVWMDIKPDNILHFLNQDHESTWVGIDLEGAQVFNALIPMKATALTSTYLPPELCRSSVSMLAHWSMDIWSLGITLCEIFAAKSNETFWSALKINDSSQVLDKLITLTQEDVDESLHSLFHENSFRNSDLRRLLGDILRINPAERIPADQIAKRKIFAANGTSSEYLHNLHETLIGQNAELIAKLDRVELKQQEIKEDLHSFSATLMPLICDIRDKLAKHTHALNSLLTGEGRLPGYILIEPFDIKDISIKNRLNPERMYKDKYNVYCICPCTLKRGNAYTLSVTKAWIAKVAPIVNICLVVLKIAAAAGGIPLPIPLLPAGSTGLDYVDAMKDLLKSSVDKHAKDLDKHDFEEVEKHLERITHAKDREELDRIGCEINSLGYQRALRLLQELEPKNPPGQDWIPEKSGLVRVKAHDGVIAWVHSDAKDYFEKEGARALILS